MSGLEIAAAGAGVAGTLLGGYGEYKSGMDSAAAIDASRPYDLINATNRAQGLKYAADTALAGSQRQAQARSQDKELLLSKSRALAAASGGGAQDTSVINQEALIERQGEFYKALEMFGGLEQSNQLNYESQNALLEGVNTYNAKGVAASRARSAARMQAVGTLLQGAGSEIDRYNNNRRRFPTFDKEISFSEANLRGAAVEAEYAHRDLERENARLRRRSLRGLGGRYSSIYDWED
ncbi:hypothetical protein IYW40_09155 [Methylocystis sp. H4A]|uniref:hypothetical protein n=1 Tax=Methylocystis sp. H4A TaxID=2785788 RepID=UPI0018C1DD68|nr:hypothetical protein [Methylocystis sp. H4A]MBG0801651.1 hypothetical protein [Methylocystis sp. H4A]